MAFDFVKKLTGKKIPPEEIRGKFHERDAQNNLKDKCATATVTDARVWDDGRMGIFRLKPTGELWPYKAGQYTSIGLDVPKKGFVVNAYSMASAPTEAGVLEFLVVLVHGGALTPTMVQAKPGDTWHYLKPAGLFHLGKTERKSLLMAASGTGIAPIRSMVKSLVDAGTIGDYRIVVANGVRWSASLAYRDEFEGWQKQFPDNVMYLPAVSRPDGDKGFGPGLAKGRIDAVVTSALGLGGSGTLPSGIDANKLKDWCTPGACCPMLVGRPDMIKGLEAKLKSAGYDEMLKEDYW